MTLKGFSSLNPQHAAWPAPSSGCGCQAQPLLPLPEALRAAGPEPSRNVPSRLVFLPGRGAAVPGPGGAVLRGRSGRHGVALGGGRQRR